MVYAISLLRYSCNSFNLVLGFGSLSDLQGIFGSLLRYSTGAEEWSYPESRLLVLSLCSSDVVSGLGAIP